MKKRNDEDIKKVLGELPSMDDRQSKETLYQKVSSRVNTPKRKVAPWLFPGLATIAVLLVLAVFIPVFFSNNGMLTVEESADRANENAESSSATEETAPSLDSSTSESEKESAEIKEAEPSSEDKDLPPEENVEESQEKEEESKLEETQEEPEAELESLVLRSDEGGYDTVSYPGKNAEVILPTLQKQQDVDTFSPERYGLAERAVEGIEYEVDETKGSAVVTFPDGFTVSGSAWASAIVESIRWDLENFQLEEIFVQTESGNPVNLGSYGEMSEVPVIQQREYIFQLYQYEGSSERLLAPISVDGSPTFQDALSLMKEKGRGLFVSPAVPEHVQFTSTTVDEGIVNINLQHESWASEQQLLTMVEAILVTAGQFGFEKVKFNGVNVREFSTYDLEEPIDVPDRINPVVE